MEHGVAMVEANKVEVEIICPTGITLIITTWLLEVLKPQVVIILVTLIQPVQVHLDKVVDIFQPAHTVMAVVAAVIMVVQAVITIVQELGVLVLLIKIYLLITKQLVGQLVSHLQQVELKLVIAHRVMRKSHGAALHIEINVSPIILIRWLLSWTLLHVILLYSLL